CAVFVHQVHLYVQQQVYGTPRWPHQTIGGVIIAWYAWADSAACLSTALLAPASRRVLMSVVQ
ncbi:MAG: hypothetical protein AB7K36_07405, partial [Chloroflexota bacterium]